VAFAGMRAVDDDNIFFHTILLLFNNWCSTLSIEEPKLFVLVTLKLQLTINEQLALSNIPANKIPE